jgi:peptidoglycan/LPS O-acetylase OafA/YrhL
VRAVVHSSAAAEGAPAPIAAAVRHDEYYPLFDYLRITLAVGVFAAHADGSGVLPVRFGGGCVQVFFALSGFLIGGILLQAAPRALPRFYFNRCTRIWVPYGIAFALLFAGTVLRQGIADAKLREFLFYKLTFVYNLFGPPQLAAFRERMPLNGTGNHFWSICVEEQFYLVAPFVIVFLGRWRVPLLVAAFGAALAAQYAAAAAIILGVLLAASRARFGEWYARGGAMVLLALVAAVGLVGATTGRTAYWWSAPAGAALVALLARRGVHGGVGAFLGGMSYPFYLDHWVGLVLRKKMGAVLHLGALASTLAALAIGLAVAALHYRYIDRVILSRRSQWYTRRRGLVACAVGLSLVAVGLVGGLAYYRAPFLIGPPAADHVIGAP